MKIRYVLLACLLVFIGVTIWSNIARAGEITDKAFDLRDPMQIIVLHQAGLPDNNYQYVSIPVENMLEGFKVCEWAGMKSIGKPLYPYGIRYTVEDRFFFCAPPMQGAPLFYMQALCTAAYKLPVKLYEPDNGVLICGYKPI